MKNSHGPLFRPLTVLILAIAFGLGGLLVYLLLARSNPRVPESATVLMQIREVARLETLEVSLYKKITFTPDPPMPGTLWDDVNNWVRFSLRAPKGKAIVFAIARLGIDLEKLGVESVAIQGRVAFVVLPPIKVSIEIKPGEVEIIGSNLDSQETAQLFELAKTAFEREAGTDAQLAERARKASERAIRGLLLTLGFTDVRFVDVLPPEPKSSFNFDF
ncbi:MAG: hypothetical protein A2X86_00260 [Bdellovibrionales bacterium GWA2_49_15]|nr:MAG: hypothetical protein A2X86_00260 [Bdellovibrionales bacterium GWA2_49_15]HAZ14475.1 DUF4230 domain-containing protein [Bdellovibrionales bacterium]